MDCEISVSVVIFSGENIVFMKNQTEYNIKLIIPGGKLKDGEDIISFASKVAEESTGINVKIDKRLSGVITRHNREGKLMVTFIILAEVNTDVKNDSAVLIPYENVERFASISEFSMYMIKRLKSSASSGLFVDEVQVPDGRKYISFF